MDNNCNPCNTPAPVTYSASLSSCCSTPTGSMDASKIVYTGPNLSCLSTKTGDTVESILQRIDMAVCQGNSIDWDSFNYSCLADYKTAGEFVEGISSFVCDTRTDLDALNATYNTTLVTINTEINALNNPGITSCSYVGITNTDKYLSVLQKLSIAICKLEERTDVSNTDTDCMVMDPAPTTIKTYLEALFSKICELEANIPKGDLPTVNNLGTCLPSPTSSDSLYTTLVKVRDYLCNIPTFDIDDLSWSSCIANPSPGTGNNLTDVLDIIISRLQVAYSKRVTTFDATKFAVSYPDGPCGGASVTLQSNIGSDKFVATNVSDNSPGYLASKLVAGTNITLPVVGGQIQVNSTAPNDKIRATSTDATAGFLDQKLDVKNTFDGAITFTENYNSTTGKLEITPTVDYTIVTQNILSVLTNNSTLNSVLCAMTCDCDCDSTTTTTTTSSANRYVILSVTNATAGDVDLKIDFGQNSPSVTWLSSVGISVPTTAPYSSGLYQITTVAANPLTNLTVTNGEDVPLNYDIEVVDNSNSVTTPASSSLAGTLLASGSVAISPFNLGTGAIIYRVQIIIS